jgi:hypothetical protein
MVPQTPEKWRRYAAASIAAAALLATACGGSGGAKKAAPRPAVATISVPEMCRDLSDLHNLFAQVGLDTTLAAVKLDFGNLVATATKNFSAQPPLAVAAPVDRLVGDLTSIYQWVQTKATQKDLADNTLPPAVKARFDDIGAQYKKIDSWSAKNCR